MTDVLVLISTSEDVCNLATTDFNKYDSHTEVAQSQLGKKFIVENLKLIVAIYKMSDVMTDNERENELLQITLEATESKLGGPITLNELADYRNTRKILLSISAQTNNKFLNKCKS